MRGASRLSALRAFWQSRTANVAVFGALCAPLMVVLAAVAIDEGALYSERRAQQGLADLAAIMAAANPGQAQQAVLLTLRDNGIGAVLDTNPFAAGAFVDFPAGGAKVSVTGGHYSNDLRAAPDQRFVAGAKPVNAFQVKLARPGERYFGGGWMPPPTLQTSAIGYAAPEAAFTVGSRLARLDGGVANAVLSALLGGEVSLSLMDYRALFDARVGVLDLLDALALDLRLTAATYADVLDAQVTVPALAQSMAGLPGLNPASAAALRRLGRAGGAETIRLAELFDLGSGATQPLAVRHGGLAASAGALDVLSAAAALARGGRQAEARLDTGLPGILDATLSLAIGERPQGSSWLAVGERGESVRTAQTRLLLRVRLAGPGGPLGATVTLPLYAELAFAEAELTDIACAAGQAKPTRVTVAARPGIAELRIADPSGLSDLSRSPAFAPATLIEAGPIKIRGSASVSVADTSATSLDFTTREIELHAVKTVSSRDILASPTRSLLDSLRLDESGPGAGLSAALGPALGRSLGEAAGPVDTLLQSVLAALGLSLGEADVSVAGGVCSRAVLVQ